MPEQNWYSMETVEGTIEQFITWANENTDELIILVVTHCACNVGYEHETHIYDQQCDYNCGDITAGIPPVKAVYEKYGIPIWNCASLDISTTSMAEIMELSKL